MLVLEELSPKAGRVIRDTDQLVDEFGVDSLNVADLLLGIERVLDVTFPPGAESRFAGVETVGELVDLVAALEPRIGSDTGAQ